jgi:hypothetical protein
VGRSTSVWPVPRRHLVPLALLAVLAIGALVFALLGASSAPSGATLAVQSASSQTFGYPPGSTSFRMDLVASVSSGASNQSESEVRQIRFASPHHMAIYQVTSTTKYIGLLNPAGATCALSSYMAVVGGSTPWTPQGKTYQRTESLADYSARVPQVTPTTCAPQPSAVTGTVHEQAVVKSGYLLGVRITISVPKQNLSNGTPAAFGREGEALIMIEINGKRTGQILTPS